MSETLARPTLSGDTRQCACGGWTRFVVCQYCGTTDPAVAAAGWVSSSPLTVPTAFDPVAVPPPAAPPVVPAPLVAQHDAPAMAGAASAFADLHAPLAAYPTPAAPQAFSAPTAAPADAPFPAPSFAPEAPVAFSPAGDPGASLVGAGGPVTYPAPLPVPPGAAWPQGEAPAAPAPMPFAPAAEAVDLAEAAPAAAAKVRGARPRWVVPAAGVAVVAAAAAAAYFGSSSHSSNDGGVVPANHSAVAPGSKILESTVPAGYTMSRAPKVLAVSAIAGAQLDGHATAGVTAAVTAAATGPAGEIDVTSLTFPDAAAATAFVADTKHHQAAITSSFASRGKFAYAVVSTASGAKAKAIAPAVSAWATSLGG